MNQYQGYGNNYGYQKKELPQDQNVQFYLGQLRTNNDYDYKIDEILEWQGNYKQLEDNHSYIQWIFPNHIKSSFNYQSPPLSIDESNKFKRTYEIGEKMVKAYKMMLNFYGMELVNAKGDLKRSYNYYERFNQAIVYSHHNHLRITRIMNSLNVNGFSLFASKLFYFLHNECYNIENSPLKELQKTSSWNFWEAQNSRNSDFSTFSEDQKQKIQKIQQATQREYKDILEESVYIKKKYQMDFTDPSAQLSMQSNQFNQKTPVLNLIPKKYLDDYLITKQNDYLIENQNNNQKTKSQEIELNGIQKQYEVQQFLQITQIQNKGKLNQDTNIEKINKQVVNIEKQEGQLKKQFQNKFIIDQHQQNKDLLTEQQEKDQIDSTNKDDQVNVDKQYILLQQQNSKNNEEIQQQQDYIQFKKKEINLEDNLEGQNQQFQIINEQKNLQQYQQNTPSLNELQIQDIQIKDQQNSKQSSLLQSEQIKDNENQQIGDQLISNNNTLNQQLNEKDNYQQQSLSNQNQQEMKENSQENQNFQKEQQFQLPQQQQSIQKDDKEKNQNQNPIQESENDKKQKYVFCKRFLKCIM